MNDFRIFTESKADIKFLKDFVAEVHGRELGDGQFEPLGSWSGYKIGGVLNTLIQENFDNDDRTILVLDADNDFKSRKAEVFQDFERFKIPIELFLFPNNSQNGNLEALLAEIAVDRKIMDCFLEYEKCVSGHSKPLNDARIYSYLDMILHPNPINADKEDLRKDNTRNYRIKDHWNLNHLYLEPLKTFLGTLF
jgi:hypothetical protein